MRETRQRGLNRQRSRLRNGLTLPLCLLLIGCASWQSVNVTPDYSPEFLEQVADEYKSRTYGEATVKAIDDWSVIISD